MERVLVDETCHCSQISKEDIHQIKHAQLTLDHLTKVSCMGATKLKSYLKKCIIVLLPNIFKNNVFIKLRNY